MKKKYLFLFMLTGLFSVIFSPYKSIIIKTTLIPKEACNIGSGSVAVKAIGKDNTSGVNTWLCYNTNGNWVSCPNSSLCNNYTINGWNNYTQVKAVDTAGNQSASVSLYDMASYSFSGTATDSSLITLKADNNAVSIINKSATIGTINSTSIADTDGLLGRVIVSGYPAKSTDTGEKPVSYGASLAPMYECSAGKVVYRNGKYMCDAESYRLQNATCGCVLAKNSSGKYYHWGGGCVRETTFCSDQYSSSATDYDNYKVITNRESNNQTETGEAVSSSNLFARPKGTTCYTYYKKDGDGKSFNQSFDPKGIWHYCTASYESYSCWWSNLRESIGFENDSGQECCKNYNPLPVTDGVQKLMVKASKEATPCDNSSTEVVEGDGYYSSSVHGNLCKRLADELNKNPNFATGAKFDAVYESDGIEKLLIPTFGSGACNFKSGDATKVSAPNGNSQTGTIGNIPYYFYCPDGSKPTQNGNSFSCTKYEYTTVTTYKYDWTVNYYKKN